VNDINTNDIKRAIEDALPTPPLHKHHWLDYSTHNEPLMRKAYCPDCGEHWYHERSVPLPVHRTAR
jgi:hypothetical protein